MRLKFEIIPKNSEELEFIRLIIVEIEKQGILDQKN